MDIHLCPAMAFLIPENNIYLDTLSMKKPALVFDIYLPETANELVGIPVNLYKANNTMLKYIADELNIPAFEHMKKKELACVITQYLHFAIPAHLKHYNTGPVTFKARYSHIQQLYIPLVWQISAGIGFRICNTPPGEETVWYFSNLKKNTALKLRAICNYIGVEDAHMLNKDEILDLLEDKIIFQERAS